MSQGNGVSLQADVGNIPQSSLATLGSLRPLLRALTADDVVPMAVLQVEAIGACFHLNGKFAETVPDFLVRSNSARLDRIAQWVGWIAGDTASMMAGTAAGRSASMLATMLVETFGETGAGEIFYQLSSRILHSDQTGSSMSQLSRVAKTLSNKLGVIGFGTHLAEQATRIRETYFKMNLEVTRTLLDVMTTVTMVEVLTELHRALTEEATILYVEGFHGIGQIVAFLTALCPDDVSVAVEGETIFRGHRRSVIVSIIANQPVKFGVETVLLNEGKNLRHIVSTAPDPVHLSSKWWKLKWDGFLAAHLDLTLLNEGVRATEELRSLCADFIASIVFSLTGDDLYSREDPQRKFTALLHDGFKAILGPFARTRVRECLVRILLVEPSFTAMDYVLNYVRLRGLIPALVPNNICQCPSSCFRRHVLADSAISGCPVARVWDGIMTTIHLGVAAVFVTSNENATVLLSAEMMSRVQLTSAIMFGVARRVVIPRKLMTWGYSALALHKQILQLVTGDQQFDIEDIGTSSGSSSIYPSTLQEPAVTNPPCLEYKLMDGQFHDGRNYYDNIRDSNYVLWNSRKPLAVRGNDLDLSLSPIVPSSLGVHSNIMITARPAHRRLLIRMLIQIASKEVESSFLHAHFGYMSIRMAKNCSHNPRNPLDKALNKKVLATSVAAAQGDESLISMSLTHGNPEAQFLSCGYGIHMLFQSGCCLNCAVKQAETEGFRMVIQG